MRMHYLVGPILMLAVGVVSAYLAGASLLDAVGWSCIAVMSVVGAAALAGGLTALVARAFGWRWDADILNDDEDPPAK